jgi:hypothetical protein
MSQLLEAAEFVNTQWSTMVIAKSTFKVQNKILIRVSKNCLW